VSVFEEVLAANREYAASFGTRGELSAPPTRHFAILTCMDARLDPAAFSGLVEGDAHVIRNAGGRASDDAIRSLVMSYSLLGTTEWLVIHHTDCGLLSVTDDKVREVLASRPDIPDATEAKFIDWLTLDDEVGGVVEDVARLRRHPLVPESIAISGYIYDVRTGQLREVPEADRK
jgi:carbonic anhydrase